MDEKFSLNDIARLLAEQVAIEPAKSENFIKVLVELINEGIRRDGIVKIKGFGTFKIVLIKERESVHVNTGERITIPPHHKLSFKPDDELKDLINKHFSVFKTEVIRKSSETTLLSDNNITENTDQPQNEEQLISDYQMIEDGAKETSGEDDEIQENTIPPTIIPINQESKNVPPPPPPIKTEDKQITKATISGEEAETPWVTNKVRQEKAVTPNQAKTQEQKTASHPGKKKSSLMPLYIILGILILVCIGCVWYYFTYSRSFDSYADNYNTKISNEFALPADPNDATQGESLKVAEDSVGIKNDTDTVSKVNPNQQSTTPASNNTATGNTTEKRQTASTTKPAATSSGSTTSSGNTNKVLAKVKLEAGSRLTLLAQKYYGNKVFWVYIYDYNKDKIGSNPDNVKAGMEILIPAKDIYGIDNNDANSREKARKLQTQLISGNK